MSELKSQLLEEDTKRCCTCKEERGLDSFHSNKGTKDGKAYMCKECKSKKAKAYRESDLGKDSKRAWREKNKDLVNAQKRVKRNISLEAREADNKTKRGSKYKA